MHRSWLVPLLSGLLAVVIVTGVVAVATHDSRPSAAPTRPTTTTGPAPSTTSTTAAPATTSTTVAAAPAPGSVEAFVPVAEKFVEQHRGLTFKQPVPVTVLDDAAFRKKLAADDTPDDPAEIQKSQKDLRALGLIPPGLDLAKTENELLGGAVSGFYDSKAKALFVRGVAATPYVREVIVHELTHAVQDQYFGLDRPGLTNRDDEAFDGFQALYEGDAERVRGEYHDSLPASQQAASDQEEQTQANGISPDIPPVLGELSDFPYEFGPRFTQALVQAGGLKRLDAAFTNPPTTTEQIIHPAKFLAGEGPKPVTAPAADGTSFDAGVLGELGLEVTLLSAVGHGLTTNQVAVAVAGWGGDRYVAWEQSGQSCLRDNIVMDTRKDSDELLSALRAWAGTRKGVTVTGSGPITVTACA